MHSLGTHGMLPLFFSLHWATAILNAQEETGIQRKERMWRGWGFRVWKRNDGHR